MVGPVRGTDRYFGPSAVVREIPFTGGLTLSSNVRNVTFIGKGQNNLTVLNEQKTRNPLTSLDALNNTGVRSVLNVGDFIDVSNYIEHRPFFDTTNLRGSGILLEKVSLFPGRTEVQEQEYEIEVLTTGSAGKYTVKNLTTGVTSPILTASNIYGREVVDGFILLVKDTLGTQPGDKVKLSVRGTRVDGDFKITTNSEVDWSLGSRSTEFLGTISPVVQLNPNTTLVQRSINPNPGNPFAGSGLLSSQVIPYEFNSVALDDATYKIVVAVPRDTTVVPVVDGSYRILKTKNNVTKTVWGVNTITKQVTDVFTNGQPYTFDGLTVNLVIDSASGSSGFEVGFFSTTASMTSVPTNGVNELGLSNNLLTMPRIGSQMSDTYAKFRVRNSGSSDSGTYVMEVQNETGNFTSEYAVSTAINTTLIPGLDYRLPNTQLRITTGISDNANLILNSSLMYGGDAPTNWSLSGTTVSVVSLESPTVGLTYSCSDNPGRMLVLGSRVSGSTDQAIFETFRLSEPLAAPTPIVMSATMKITNAPVSGGLELTFNWYDSVGLLIGTNTGTYALGTVGSTWSRKVDILTGFVGLTAPTNAAYARVIMRNTTDTASNTAIHMNALQLELGSAATTYKESDVTYFRTKNRRVSRRPLPNLSILEFSGPYNVLDSNVEFSVISGNATVKDDWYVRALTTDTLEVVRKSTGEAKLVLLGVDNTTAIDGVLVRFNTPVNSESLNDGLVLRTAARFNRTRTIEAPIYYVSYTYRRPESQYYQVKTFLQQIDVERDLGDAIPENSLSLASELAFANGATMVRLLQMDDFNDWDLALEICERIETNYVVPLITMDLVPDGDGSAIPTTQQYQNTISLINQFKNHALKMSSILQKKPRTIWTSNLRQRSVEGMKFDVENLKCDRVIYAGPCEATKNFFNRDTLLNESKDLDGCFIAAALVGLRLGQPDLATVLTRKSVSGLNSVGSRFYLEIEKDILGGSGVMLVEDRGGSLIVRHGVTTDPTNFYTQEQTVVDIKDAVSYGLRAILDSQFVGRKFTQDVISGMQSVAKDYLDSFVSNQVLQAYTGLSITRDPIEPRTVNVSFKLAPVLPINWILIEFQLTRV